MKNLFDRAKLFFSKDREFRSALYAIMGFYPHNIDLYRTAFAHKSQEYRSKRNGYKPLNNERLEFLGDAVLETVVSDIVYRHFPNKREGFLTNTRSKIVSRESLGQLAKELHIDRLLQSQISGRSQKSYLPGNTFEALMGAIYLDRGFRYAYRFVEQRIIGAALDLKEVAEKEVNFKSKLLEWCQKNKIRLELKEKGGQGNNESFHTTIIIEGLYAGDGRGISKKESHQSAAKEALTRMRREANFIDQIFRAKEGRTAMEANEVFCLPKIAEIEAELAKEVTVPRKERSQKERSAREEKPVSKSEKKAERKAEAPQEKPAKEKVSKQATPRNAEKSAEKAAETATDKAPEKAKEKAANAPTAPQKTKAQPAVAEARIPQVPLPAPVPDRHSAEPEIKEKTEEKNLVPQSAPMPISESSTEAQRAIEETVAAKSKQQGAEKTFAHPIVEAQSTPEVQPTAEEQPIAEDLPATEEQAMPMREVPTMELVPETAPREEAQDAAPMLGVEPSSVPQQGVESEAADVFPEAETMLEAPEVKEEEAKEISSEAKKTSPEKEDAPLEVIEEKQDVLPTTFETAHLTASAEAEELVEETPSAAITQTAEECPSAPIPAEEKPTAAPRPRKMKLAYPWPVMVEEEEEEAPAAETPQAPSVEPETEEESQKEDVLPTVELPVITSELEDEISETPETEEQSNAATPTSDDAPLSDDAPRKKTRRGRRAGTRQNAKEYANTTPPAAEQSHRAEKHERRQKEAREQRAIERAKKMLGEATDRPTAEQSVAPSSPDAEAAMPPAEKPKRHRNSRRGAKRKGEATSTKKQPPHDSAF